jgi:hypothetical protein
MSPFENRFLLLSIAVLALWLPNLDSPPVGLTALSGMPKSAVAVAFDDCAAEDLGRKRIGSVRRRRSSAGADAGASE